MNYEHQYNARLEKIEAELGKTFPRQLTKTWISAVAGETISSVKAEDYRDFCEPARELLLRGGKRWRPVMMLLSCELAGGGDKVLPLTPLVEFPHNGSLVVDDIEDGSEWRRGGKCVHLIYGEDLAINAGNLLYFLPTYIIGQTDLPDKIKLDIFGYYSEGLRRLHFGQGLDILWHRNKNIIPEPEEYEQMCRFKTGSLSRMAAQIGALTGGGTDKQINLLAGVCEDMGVGFQIMDDVLNLTTGNPGKGRGDDIVEGKKSLPVIYHLEENKGDLDVFKKLFTAAEGKGLEEAREEIDFLIKLMEQSGSLEKARKRGKLLLDNAAERVLSIFGESEASLVMTGMIGKFAGKY